MIKKLAALAAMCILPLSGFAQARWPDKPVRIIVPWAPGGMTDGVARMLATKLATQLKQPFIVENRPGAGGMIAADFVAKAPADGYTLLFASAAITVNSTLMASQFKIDARKDYTPIILAASEPLVLTVPASSNAKSVADLVRLSKANSSGLSASHGGIGTTSHIAAEMFAQQAGAKVISVAYKGGAPATTALLTGEVQFSFANLATVKPHMEAGTLRGLAVTSEKRSSVLPNLPTMASTLPNFETGNWFGLLGPRGMPIDVVKKLNQSAVQVLNADDVRESISKTGGEIVASTPEQFERHLAEEVGRYAQVIKKAEIKPN
ncbi:Bug family tripartite tricarboxylate transporter substrate binding protein [Bradyrhizobium arachidis]|uniref:Tripartite tricarboxylate transporter substrate binding protein n=1 Tax=Bradyrhizobium arachidis TaxID=858423 RepID=A0AAE7NXH7_9BRAD|nr:tripartite tricarboxylate transporter substrate binding protein [Bradyrhizobium arachidis]QOZ70684.1 tripartite tricarboxylate transporter substrate binding protein [Bradyrhizobium arachidis]SFV19218.1 Tripartite-type tricarboxylate transporter, receptor component TctC [Bradyrhizobium arachidis]